MAKKKAAKPQRGVATTSIASKKQVEELKVEKESAGQATPATEEDASVKQRSSEAGPTGAKDTTPSNGHGTSASREEWEDEEAAEEAALQTIVERLQDKGEKEVNRIIKAIEYDKRMAVSFPALTINTGIRDEVLDLELSKATSTITNLNPSTTASETDKTLLRIFVAYHVLLKLGFSEARVTECLLQGVNELGGWEGGLEWMWLHLTEDECLSQNAYAKSEQSSLVPSDEALVEPPLPLDELHGQVEEAETKATVSAMTSTPDNSGAVTSSLFEKHSADGVDHVSDSETDSNPDLAMQKDNQNWAELMLQLDGLRIAAGAERNKGGKKKSSGVILETQEMRKVKERISKIEKEYLFSRKDADILLRDLRARRDAAALEERLRGGKTPKSGSSGVATPLEEQAVSKEDGSKAAATPEEDEEEGGLFGTMLDEPQAAPTDSVPETSNSSIISVRSMPIPKSFSFAGNVPKSLLRVTLSKSVKSAAVIYVKLSGHSRAARAGLEIRYSATSRRVWRMDDIACDDMTEAENYVSTLALYDLGTTGQIGPVNWKTLPLPFRDLWEEQEKQRKEKEDTGKRAVWRTIKSLVDQKTAPKAVFDSEKAVKHVVPDTGSITSRTPDTRIIERLQQDFMRRKDSPAYQKMIPQRESLPIASFRQTIIDTLESNQVLVLSGETGCGKSTQLPAYILEDQLSKGIPCKIYVTEPRRISAISLAQRVSQELGDAPGVMGSNSSLVGYSIRLEAKISPNTRLAFVTNGIALRMLEGGSAGRGTAFDEVTHIIVDEVHERSIDSDFLLIVLKQLMQQRPTLKIVLMSATLDAEKISAFFGGCPMLSVPGRTFPVQVNYLEDAIELAKWNIEEGSPYAIRTRNIKTGAKQLEWTEDGAKSEGSDSEDDDDNKDPAKLSSAKYSGSTVSTVNLLDSRQIPYDLIIRLLETICFENEAMVPFSQAVLVFLPGLAEIRKLNDSLQSHRAFGSHDFVIYPLHSTISSEGQSAVFDLPPQGVRKIVISTNIAETGVTIPDITCVIDTGKHREMRYDEKRQISRLVETYIARSNAKQRRGRAGRVQEGLAFHLFTKARHDLQLAAHPIPEMLRLSLQDLALRIKVLKVKLGNSIESVLLQALDPPSSVNIQRAIASLVEVKALTTLEEITPMGRLLSKLPMDVHLGKFLLMAALLRCLDPALTIAATLNSKSPFVTPFGYESQADAAKRTFAVGNSDFLTLANVFASWRRASDNPAFARTFCSRNYLSHKNLQEIEELRQQLLSYLVDSSFVEVTPAQRQEITQSRYSRGFRTRFVTVPPDFNVNADNVAILGAALASGLYPKLLSLESGGLKTITNQQPVAKHPTSVNFKASNADLGTNYLVYFTIMQSKRLYAWETGPVDDRALALLCGDNADFRVSASFLQLDRKVRYRVQSKDAIAIKILRERFQAAVSNRMRGRQLSEDEQRWFDLGIRCLGAGAYEDDSVVGVVQ